MDDSEINLKVAQSLLSTHNVVVVNSFCRAIDAISKSKFDVLLTDLLVPSSQAGASFYPLNGKEHPHQWVGMENQEVPLGLFLAIHAIGHGIKLVAVVTDANHHDHPAARALDSIFGIARLGDAKLHCVNDAQQWLKEETLEPLLGNCGGWGTACKNYEHVVQGDCIVGFKGLVKGKAWHTALEKLIEG